ncbi:MAG: hypothetical protein APF80_17325 [Alphaproteobacteria bacterium BRH_c36]|nr:MAG: hypothetical protein APF80_17325 [Alphaproteobacteria bacterium BRH_c36]
MTGSRDFSRVSVRQLGLALTAFFVATYILCIALGVIVPDWEMHKPWLQFFPGFEWLTLQGFLVGLVESVIYAWYIAVLFGWLFNNLGSQARA